MKPTRERDQKYLNFIKSCGCIIPGCGRIAPSEPHHWNKDGHSGMGTKCSDKRTIPLCHNHHQEVHSGKKSFKTKYSLDPEYIIERLNKIWSNISRQTDT